MSTGTLFDLGGGPNAAAHDPAPARRGGQRKVTRKGLPQPPAPHASAVPQGVPTTTIATDAAPDPTPPPIDPDDTSFYALGRRLLRASSDELAEVDARHRALGYGREPSEEALAGAISACAPVPYAGPIARCSCGAEMPARLLEECAARAADPSVWSLHRERLAGRAGAP